jgi:hypothetical protein
MLPPNLKLCKIKVGDLVNHLLMSDTWVGVVVKIAHFDTKEQGGIDKAFIYILSTHYFSKWHSAPEQRAHTDEANELKTGWVDVDFLKVISRGTKNG